MLKRLKKFLKDEGIVDIVLYGSKEKGRTKPGDRDILVIFKGGRLKDRLDIVQKIKKDLNCSGLDIKQILVTDIFNPAFFARTSIFLEGVSVKSGSHFSRSLGFKAYSLFSWSLRNLKHAEKVKFNYILSGRGGAGLLDYYNGKRLASGAALVPIESSDAFEEALHENKVGFSRKNILVEG